MAVAEHDVVFLIAVLAKNEREDLIKDERERGREAGEDPQDGTRHREEVVNKGDERGLRAGRTPTLADQLISGLDSAVEAVRSGEPLERRLTVRAVKLDLEPSPTDPTS